MSHEQVSLTIGLLQILLLLFLSHEGCDWKRLSNPHRRLEIYFLACRAFHAHLSYGHPQKNLLALNAGHLLHLELLHIRRYLRGIAHPGIGPNKEMLVWGPLLHPNKPGFPNSPTFFKVLEGKHAFGEPQLLQEVYGMAVALF